VKNPYNKYSQKNKSTLFLSLFIFLFFSAVLLPGKDVIKPLGTAKKKAPDNSFSKGQEIFCSQVKYSLSYLGLKICDPLQGQEDQTLVYKLEYNELSDKILLPIQQLLSHNHLQAGKLTKFPDNQGFSYRVLYQHKHIGDLIIINERAVSDNPQHFITSPRKPVRNKELAKMAIIIDDFGFSDKNLVREFLQMNVDITISIIPGHEYSTWTAEEAQKQGKEVIIHMPMASQRQDLDNGELNFLLSDSLGEAKIRERVEKAMTEIPDAVGMNNHMGSVATASPDVVLPLIRVLKEKELYFIDSLTSPLSIMYENCIVQEVPTGRRRIFLDNDPATEKILKQFRKAIKIAKKSGSVIVTGHTYAGTLEAIHHLQATGEFDEILICPASEIVE